LKAFDRKNSGDQMLFKFESDTYSKVKNKKYGSNKNE